MNANDMSEFVNLSRRTGERFDLIQAGGGNSSLKLGGSMLIKTSGISLADVTADSGHCEVGHVALAAELRALASSPDAADRSALNSAAALALARNTRGGRASIETFMHTLMGRCVLHTHPVTVSSAACSANWREILSAEFPDAILAPYTTAGAALAIELMKLFDEKQPDFENGTILIFLQNHGMVVSAPTAEAALTATEDAALRLERSNGSDFSAFRRVSEISALINGFFGTDMICHACTDADVVHAAAHSPQALAEEPFSPDIVVYTGLAPLAIGSTATAAALAEYAERYSAAPRIVLAAGSAYVMADTLRKARDIESVIKYNILVRAGATGRINPMPPGEAEFIAAWEAERHREKL